MHTLPNTSNNQVTKTDDALDDKKNDWLDFRWMMESVDRYYDTNKFEGRRVKLKINI